MSKRPRSSRKTSRSYKRRKISQGSRGYRYRRRYGRKRFARRSRRGTQPRRLTVKRQVFAGTINFTTTAVTSNFWQYVQPSLTKSMADFGASPAGLAGFPDMSNYEGLYEQAKLNAIKYKFVPRLTNYNTQAQTTVTASSAAYYTRSAPKIAIVNDPRSTITPSGVWGQGILNTLMEHGCRVVRGDRPFSVYLKPLVQDTVAGGTVYKYIKPPLVDLNTSGKGLNHRGFHMFMYNDSFDPNSIFTGNNGWYWDVYVTYYVTFHNPK